MQDTLYGAICRRKHKNGAKPYPYDELLGDGQIDDVVLVDQSPIGRSPRSNPVTYIKAFDEIRAVFAATIEARTHNYGAGHFSFNVDGGRCSACEGDGYKEIDMQFLADVYMKCDQCDGTRYRKEILEITYRGRNIAEVLDMTVREAFTFFRGQTKVQAKLKRLAGCRAGLPAARPRGQHAVDRRGPATEAGQLHVGREDEPHAVHPGRTHDRPAFLGRRAAARLFRHAVERRALADRRGTQPPADEGGRLPHRPGAGAAAEGRPKSWPPAHRRKWSPEHPESATGCLEPVALSELASPPSEQATIRSRSSDRTPSPMTLTTTYLPN